MSKINNEDSCQSHANKLQIPKYTIQNKCTAQNSNTNIQNPNRKQLLQQELIDLLTRTSKNYLANHNVISKEHKLFLRKKMKT